MDAVQVVRDAAINPGATEICGDRHDNDCDGLVDVDDPDCPLPIGCFDEDGDGFVDCEDADCVASRSCT